MNRRKFLRGAGVASVAAAIPVAASTPSDPALPFDVTGLDVTITVKNGRIVQLDAPSVEAPYRKRVEDRRAKFQARSDFYNKMKPSKAYPTS